MKEQKPVTNEYAEKRLRKALNNGDLDEAQKWAFIIKANNDFRLTARERERKIKEHNLELLLRHSYDQN